MLLALKVPLVLLVSWPRIPGGPEGPQGATGAAGPSGATGVGFELLVKPVVTPDDPVAIDEGNIWTTTTVDKDYLI